MDFDEVELDMIRRGDMLGPTLGAKAANALETLQRERDEAVRIAKDTAVALTGLTPGGSEYCSYSRMLDTYFADIEACVGAVRRRYEDGHNARLALVEMRKERDEAREALDRANDYLRFVARWAWRESEGLTDVERLSAIKYYPPIKALAAGEPAPLSPKEAEE